MKSKEEIEQLAEQKYPQGRTLNVDYISASERSAYKKGYTQCQEDMADKKYTEADIRDILENYFSYITCHISQYCDKEDLQQPYKWLDINLHSLSLNKQD